MPPLLTLKVNEIFSSIQGEGLRQGEPTIFIRLTGCNLHCRFCDTKHAWAEGEVLTVAEVMEKVRKARKRFPSSWVCLTGGEPLLQEVEELIHSLKQEGLLVQVETNGTIYRRLPVDWFTLSPKPENYFFQPEYKNEAKEVKLVVSEELDLTVLQKLRAQFAPQIPIILQPQSNLKWSRKKAIRLLIQATLNNLPNLRIFLQLHKILRIK